MSYVDTFAAFMSVNTAAGSMTTMIAKTECLLLRGNEKARLPGVYRCTAAILAIFGLHHCTCGTFTDVDLVVGGIESLPKTQSVPITILPCIAGEGDA